ncbi:SMP-30/gluconolactonase/LRE family protein [Aquiflexum gelatinilyticum]|uniref:SMP-30/gluconolactonase/LRE family protein n=1 Tax=Aquiflexum gelatinilyticum TaxID=2961943 RepID=A0A9X2P2G1_9BACT|nr:SMP-30/gluconolactonase/LRE family protein [Aquiflexum gelatinilyticum]MCR9014351.1 SMP-30/gluconolactonase/LRE family protein [Aquiflexum gelatinilyticum]
MKYSIVFSFFILIAISCTQPKNTMKANSSIEILDEAALSLINPDAQIEVISQGYAWTEGPLWLEKEQKLLFSDIPNNSIFQIDAKGETSLYLKPSGYTGDAARGGETGSNALILDPQGNLVLCQHGDRRMAKMNAPLDQPKADFVSIVDNYQGKRLNSPNDAIYDKAGNLYFTDPPYGLEFNVDDPAKELDFQGIYCLKTDGELLLVDSISRPNGITFSPDQSKLIVANSDPEHAVWYQYDIVTPGVVENKKLFFEATSYVGKEGYNGLPDGMKMHSSGNLFATGPGGVWLFDENGKALARIATGEATSNCAFSSDEKTLYITADNYVLKMGLK